jgi:hypothetical protein
MAVTANAEATIRAFRHRPRRPSDKRGPAPWLERAGDRPPADPEITPSGLRDGDGMARFR